MSGTIQSPPTSAMTVVSGATGVFPVSYGYYPSEGSRGVTAQYTWASVTGYNEDLSVLAAMGVETTPQAAYVDNSTVGTAVTLTVKGTGQVVTIPAGAQGVFPLFFTSTPGLFISTTATGAGVTRVTYLNVPTNAAGVWSASNTASVGALVSASAPSPFADGTTQPLSLTANGSVRFAPTSSTGVGLWQGFGTAAGNNSFGMGASGIFNPTAPTLTTGQTVGLQLDSRGDLFVNGASNQNTYATSAFITPAAAATDVFVLQGSGTKTVLVTEFTLSVTATAAGSIPVSLLRRNTLNTGGTSSSGTNVSHNSFNAAISASTLAYSANPAGLGTIVGPLEAFLAAALVNDVRYYKFEFGAAQGTQPIALVTATQCLAVNLGGGTMPAGLQIGITIRWMEV